MQQTFLMVKPDGVQRGLVGEIVTRFENKGFQLIGAKLIRVTREQAEFHYAEHKEKSFFGELVNFITSGPVFAMVWQGDDIIALARILMGKTNVMDSMPGTIRGDFAAHTPRNLIHGSDSPESAEREMGNFFSKDEQLNYEKAIGRWI
jgi:nucleoside-diphosphate kinase